MNEILGIIFASDNDQKLNELTFYRTIASLPFGGRYRAIDFALSNFVNSNITKIGIITKNNYSSLMDHIRMGRDWDLNRKNSGIAVFPPFVSNSSKAVYKGKIEALEGIIDYISKSHEEYVIVTNGNIIMNVNLSDVLDFHIDNKADITTLVYKDKPSSSKKFIIDKRRGNVVKETLISSTPGEAVVDIGLNVYLMKRELLIKIVNEAYMKGFGDFDKLILQDEKDKYKICAYDVEGFVAVIDDIKSYYKANMALLDEKTRENLFYKYGRIFTKVKDSVPSKYGDNAVVKNSLIADGCVILGEVTDSIIFRGVVIEEGAVVKNSIVMEHTKIMKDSKIYCAITDKDVIVKEDRVISGHITYPVVLAKGKQV